MTRYAFVIDQRKRIGCHACTVACKAEHDVRKAHEVYKHWFGMTRPQTNRPDGLRRPVWMIRPYRPAVSAFKGFQGDHKGSPLLWT